MKKSIENVTTDLPEIALRSVGIIIDPDTVDKIIDVVELIEEKGKKTSLKDISKLETIWGKN